MKYKMTRSFKSGVEPTEYVMQMAQMFGIGVDEEHEIVLYDGLEVEVGPGRIVFITGESGAGKSCLLRDIKDQASEHFQVYGDTVRHDGPIIDAFPGCSLKQAAGYLTSSGISEPFVMIRKPMELSDGQRYRFHLSRMMYYADQSDDDYNLIFIDEFAAFLDRVTAKVVAYQVRKMASRGRIGFVLATTHDDIIDDLQPDTTISMRLGQRPTIEADSEFPEALRA